MLLKDLGLGAEITLMTVVLPVCRHPMEREPAAQLCHGPYI